ncbi:MAG: ATP-binding cassette domain-containing protein [Actinomycetota bacterium]|nr:ATP-binding cassette domain-containing protein [Actinomycetota bacterium]
MTTTTDTQHADAHLLDVDDLRVVFKTGRRGSLTAVDGVSFSVPLHQTVGLVGESGSGKTTIARAVLGMERVTSGTISFEGNDITRSSKSERRRLTEHMQVVFQDPYSSLSPTRKIVDTLIEPLLAHRDVPRAEAMQRASELLNRVGLASYALDRYPSEFSGGQRQRIAIARALMLSPKFVVCDEPVSALDLSIQAQVLNLLSELQDEMGLSYLFIAHNLSVVRYMSHEVLVLYRGQLMERGEASAIYRSPGHPYTRMLLEASPVADPGEQAKRRLSNLNLKSATLSPIPSGGCPFSPRCAFAVEQCSLERPPILPGPAGTEVACHRADVLPWSGVVL